MYRVSRRGKSTAQREAKGRLVVIDGEVKRRKISALAEEGKKTHFREIRTVGEQLKPRMRGEGGREKLEGLDRTKLPSQLKAWNGR